MIKKTKTKSETGSSFDWFKEKKDTDLYGVDQSEVWFGKDDKSITTAEAGSTNLTSEMIDWSAAGFDTDTAEADSFMNDEAFWGDVASGVGAALANFQPTNDKYRNPKSSVNTSAATGFMNKLLAPQGQDNNPTSRFGNGSFG